MLPHFGNRTVRITLGKCFRTVRIALGKCFSTTHAVRPGNMDRLLFLSQDDINFHKWKGDWAKTVQKELWRVFICFSDGGTPSWGTTTGWKGNNEVLCCEDQTLNRVADGVPASLLKRSDFPAYKTDMVSDYTSGKLGELDETVPGEGYLLKNDTLIDCPVLQAFDAPNLASGRWTFDNSRQFIEDLGGALPTLTQWRNLLDIKNKIVHERIDMAQFLSTDVYTPVTRSDMGNRDWVKFGITVEDPKANSVMELGGEKAWPAWADDQHATEWREWGESVYVLVHFVSDHPSPFYPSRITPVDADGIFNLLHLLYSRMSAV